MSNRKLVPGEFITTEFEGKVVEVLFDGEVDLFYEVNTRPGRYFIIDEDDRIFTLVMPEKAKSESKTDADNRRTGIISILRTVMFKAPELYKDLDSFNPGRYELVNLMHKYHVAVNGSVEGILYELAPPPFIPHISINAGYHADLATADSESDLNGFNLDPAFYPSAGISISSVLPRVSQNLLFTVDVSLAKRYLYGFSSRENPTLPVTAVFYELHLHNLLIMTDIMLGYNFQIGDLNSFVSGGICTRSILTDKSRSDVDVCSDGLVVSHSYDYSSEEKNSLGVGLSLGFNFDLSKAISLTTAISYNSYPGATPYDRYNSFGLKLGVNL